MRASASDLRLPTQTDRSKPDLERHSLLPVQGAPERPEEIFGPPRFPDITVELKYEPTGLRVHLTTPVEF